MGARFEPLTLQHFGPIEDPDHMGPRSGVNRSGRSADGEVGLVCENGQPDAGRVLGNVEGAGCGGRGAEDKVTIGSTFDETLAAAQTGERDAVETIYRDVAPLVIGYLRANGARDPEDTASDVFVSMVTRLDSFKGDEPHFRSWLLTITHRRLVDDFRRRGRRPEELVPPEDIGERLTLMGDGESEAMARLRSRGVLDAVDQLTDDQRSALMLRVLADLPVAQIADIMGKPETAVKALLRRAIASLERLMSKEDASDG